MRELKFRIWDKSRNCFSTQKIIKLDGADNNFGDYHIDLDGTARYMNYDSADLDEDAVIQQYTGMKDEDGTEIYEGDIVEVSNSHKALVRWSSSGGCWEVAPIGKKYAPGFDINDPEEDYIDYNGFDEASLAFSGGNGYNGPIKILGNIFENPELLK
jgi:uncharacterized phage protein (TIGR01671 family)